MQKFKLEFPYLPSGDQPEAISALIKNLNQKTREQVLLGVTGSGKTFTMASLIQAMQRPTLIISHNKTLAAQLYQEFRDFFPKNAVSYFVSYYDYYQPEAYLPGTDTYIEKETQINEEIDKLRLAATTNLLTRRDTIIVASVSCIYNIGSPREYGHFVLELKPGIKVARKSIFDRLVQLQYERSDFGFHRGTFRVRGDTIDLFTAYEDTAIRMIIDNDKLVELVKLDPLTGNIIEKLAAAMIYPAKHYMTDPQKYQSVFGQIREDLDSQVKLFKSQGKILEAQRIEQRVNFDLEMIQEMGYVNGIENYSRYFDGRNPGDPPYTLFDYFDEATKQGPALRTLRPGLRATKGQTLSGLRSDPGISDWLLFIDESHMTIPQIRGMYNGDRSRKQTLIDFGFRLPAALDNRPLRFEEFLRRIPQTIYVSATPDQWEMERVSSQPSVNRSSQIKTNNDQRITNNEYIIEQLVRPTGLVDPEVSIRPTDGQIDDLMAEIQNRVNRHERILVTTLTKRMAEDLSKFLEEKGIKVHYLHSDVETLVRSDILADLRTGTYDVIVGINLLREGLDLPEVSLVAILDADKEGFLRSRTSLIQTMGRAARHERGEVIMYADTVTNSMRLAIAEVERRRRVQLKFNESHGITPQSIVKPIRKRLVEEKIQEIEKNLQFSLHKLESMTPHDKKQFIMDLTRAMRQASRDLDFELAAKLRDTIARVDKI